MSWLARLANLPGERRAISYAVIFGVWLQVLLYCQLHNLYLAPLAPEHFTVYHDPLWGIENLRLLAAAWAFRASIGPGIPLGLAALFVARAGSTPRVPLGLILGRLWPFLLFTELGALAAGAYSWIRGQPLFPACPYPDLRRHLITSQTIQLTCYTLGLLSAAVYLLTLWRWRMRAAA